MTFAQHIGSTYRVKHYELPDWAITDTDKPGRCTITWEIDGHLTDVQCDGWITTDGVLWAPTDGQAAPGTYFDECSRDPNPAGLWYGVRLGRPKLRDVTDSDRWDKQTKRLTLVQAAQLLAADLRTLQQAARSGTLRTEQTVRGYNTTREWLDAWTATKRRGRPRKAAV